MFWAASSLLASPGIPPKRVLAARRSTQFKLAILKCQRPRMCQAPAFVLSYLIARSAYFLMAREAATRSLAPEMRALRPIATDITKLDWESVESISSACSAKLIARSKYLACSSLSSSRLPSRECRKLLLHNDR